LFDQNLSRRLVSLLRIDFPDSSHVVLLGLDTATDREVWEYARANGFGIVSKDSDFGQLAFLYGAPPKVIWLRVGNQPTANVAEVLRAAAPGVAEFDASPTEAVLVLPSLDPTSSR
jgi:predicted nuclease of predicted toxin-antitoxin system